MDPLNEFQQKETEKLSSWFSGIYSTKEAKVHTTDLMASSSQRSPVVTETHDLGTTITPPVPVSESKASSIPNGSEVDLSDYYTKEEIDEKFAEYYTIEEIDEKFAEYYTIEEIDEKFAEYYTKQEIDNILDKYATKEWVEDKLGNYVTKDELSNYVRKDELCDLIETHFSDGGCDYSDKDEKLWNEIQKAIDDSLRELGVDASCSEGNVTVNLTGIP